MKNEIEKAIEGLPSVINTNTLYRDFIGMTNIERVEEEEFVLKKLLEGVSKADILKTLSTKYPDMKFTTTDLEKFMARNNDIVQAMGQEVTLSARRHLQAKAQVSETLAGLALYTQDLIVKFKSEGDNTNTVAAIRALNQTLENYMKMEGMVSSQNEGGKVINIVNTISDKKNSLRDKIHNANFSEIKDTDGKVQ